MEQAIKQIVPKKLMIEGAFQNGIQSNLFGLILKDENGITYQALVTCQINHINYLKRAFQRMIKVELPREEKEDAEQVEREGEQVGAEDCKSCEGEEACCEKNPAQRKLPGF